MKKIATITPTNCVTHEQDGQIFTVNWNEDDGSLIAVFEGGSEETMGYTAETLEAASDIVYGLYMASVAYVCEMEELDYEA